MAQGVTGTNEDKAHSGVQARKNSCGHRAFRDTWVLYLQIPPHKGGKQGGSTSKSV